MAYLLVFTRHVGLRILCVLKVVSTVVFNMTRCLSNSYPDRYHISITMLGLEIYLQTQELFRDIFSVALENDIFLRALCAPTERQHNMQQI